MLSVDGTATYRERIALPPDAVFEATLEDVSRADAAAIVLGRSRTEQPGNPPFSFSIPYDPTRIQPTHVYAVRAQVTVSGKLMFTTDRRYEVLTQGHGSAIGMMMLRRSSGRTDETAQAALPLRGAYWKLEEIRGERVMPADQQNEAHLLFNTEGGRVSGSGGCNRLAGSYTADEKSLRFGAMASTRMACMHGTEAESKFLQAMEQVRSWRIIGHQLELADESGRAVLQFSAQP